MVAGGLADLVVHVSCAVLIARIMLEVGARLVLNPVVMGSLLFILGVAAAEPPDDSPLDFLAPINRSLDAVGSTSKGLLDEGVEVEHWCTVWKGMRHPRLLLVRCDPGRVRPGIKIYGGLTARTLRCVAHMSS